MSLTRDFQDFLKRGNVIDLAVGVIVGGAFGKIVSAVVQDLLMPLVSLALPAGDWRTFSIELAPEKKVQIGHFVGEVIDFLIVSAVVFLVLVKFVGFIKKRAEAPAPAAPAPATKACTECLEAIPLGARRCKWCTSVVAATAVLLAIGILGFAPATAFAADPPNPQFKFEKDEPAKAGEQRLQAKGGLVVLGGNSQQTTATLGGLGAYRSGANRVSGEVGGAYARAALLLPVDMNANGIIDSAAELDRQPQTTSKMWLLKGRYDRFFTQNNSAYFSSQAMGDEPAGKEIVAGAQAGYSRQLVANQTHRLVAELGYDFAYERSTAAGAEGIQIHSGRVFASEEAKVNESTGAFVSAELLVNLNEEGEQAPGYGKVDALDDIRFLGKMGLTTTLWKNISFGFTFTLKYDKVPAPLKAPGGLMFGPGFFPRAKQIDTLTEANLIVTFL